MTNQNTNQQQNRGNNNQQRQNKPNAQTMVQTVVENLDMVSVGWNITDGQIESFVTDVMEKTGFPISAVRLKTYNKGENKEVTCFAMFPARDAKIVEGAGQQDSKILPYFQQHLNQRGIKLTQAFSDVIRPLTKGQHENVSATPKEGYLIIELDIFEVVGMMLYYDKNVHRINIPQINTIGQDTILTAYKTVITKGKPRRGSRDKFSNMI